MALTQLKTGAIADDAVTTDKLANAINTERTANTAKVSLDADSVTGAKIADDAIDSEHYTDGSVDTAHIADLNVTTGKLAADAVTGAKIADDAVGAEHIEQLDADLSFADSAKAKFGAGNDLQIDHSGTNSQIYHDGTGHLYIATQGSGEDLILQAKNDLKLSTADSERVRIDSSGNVGIGKTPARKLDIDTNHYVVTSSGQSTTGIHLDGAHGNAGEYGGGISFACGGAGSAAIAGRQASTSQHRVGLSFFTHDTTTSGDNAVEKVRLHDSGEVSFNDGICLGNSLTLSASHKLDDYEEGDWTPNDLSGSTYNVASGAVGKYIKIGVCVHAWAQFGTDTTGAVATGDRILVGDLPFNANGINNPQASLTINYTAATYSTAKGNLSASNELGFTVTQTTGHNRNGSGFYIQITYWTDS